MSIFVQKRSFFHISGCFLRPDSQRGKSWAGGHHSTSLPFLPDFSVFWDLVFLLPQGLFWASSGRGCVYHTLSAGASSPGPRPAPQGVQTVFISSCLFPEIPFLFRLINALWVKQLVLGVHTKFLELSVARYLEKP